MVDGQRRCLANGTLQLTTLMKWMTRLTIVAVFLLGVVAGSALGIKHERDRFLKMQRNGPASLVDSALKHLSGELKLTPPQRDEMRSLLTKAQPALAAAENEHRRRIIGVMESVRSSAYAFLDAGQQKLYDLIHRRMEKKLTPDSREPSMAAAMFGSWMFPAWMRLSWKSE